MQKYAYLITIGQVKRDVRKIIFAIIGVIGRKILFYSSSLFASGRGGRRR